ncbi:MAG: hemolysin family protein [Methanotrichaceae archaeon]|nr:hemolysin family protein [Methanotrichaceae archaeon]
MVTEIIILLLLIIANGIFSMSEIAIVSARKALLKQHAEEGDSSAQKALELAEDPTEFLSTIQVGITLIGILAGAYAAAALSENLAVYLEMIPPLAPYSNALSIIVVVVVITYFTIVIGELVPKRLALNDPEKIASRIAFPMTTFSRIASPVIALLSASTELILRALGVKKYEEPKLTEEELKVMLVKGFTAGVIEEAEQDIMERVFRLGDRSVDAVMTPRKEIVWLDINDTPEVIRDKLSSGSYSLFPVCKGRLDNVLGIVQSKDLLYCSIKDEKVDLKSNLLPPLFVPESMKALRVIEKFKQTGIHLAIVIDEYGSVQGVVTLTDLLEELVGDIPHIDELGEPQIMKREDGSWLLDGMLPIDEFKETFQIAELPGEKEELYQTVGGFVMMHLEKIPKEGDHFEWDEYRFEVMDMDEHRVDKILLSPPGKENAK